MPDTLRNWRPPHFSSRLAGYHRATRTATYGFLSTLPLLLAYEVLVRLANWGQVGQIRIGADVWLKQLFDLFGFSGVTALSIGILAGGVGIIYLERKRYIPLRVRYFGGILLESATFAIILTAIVSTLVGALFLANPVTPLAAAPLTDQGFLMQIALSLGAGFYEELFFRVLLVGGLYLLLRRLLDTPTRAYLWAAFIGALLFSAVHYIGPFGDIFTLASFSYRFFFGLALNAVFLWRGFGVAAWTHALYNVMLTVGLL